MVALEQQVFQVIVKHQVQVVQAVQAVQTVVMVLQVMLVPQV
jgi:hypothetical protein